MEEQQLPKLGDILSDSKPVNNIVAIFAVAMGKIIQDSMLPLFKDFYKMGYNLYLQAEAPYGETQVGFIQWLEELYDVQLIELYIERAISQQPGLLYLLKRLAAHCEPPANKE